MTSKTTSITLKKPRLLRRGIFSTKLVAFSLGVAAFAVLGLNFFVGPSKSVEAAACSRSNIVYCGFTGSNASGYISSMKSLWNANNDNGHRDIRAIFQWGGVTQDNLNTMNTNNTKVGTVDRKGNIKIGGYLIGTGAQVTTRYAGDNRDRQQVLPGVYIRSAAGNLNDPEPVLIQLDRQGNPLWAIMTRCGNTLKFTKISRSFMCSSLVATKTATPRQYVLTARASATNTAISSYVFAFGDGKSRTVNATGTSAQTTYTYAAPGTYKATVKINGNNVIGAMTETCEITITIAPEPYYSCTSLQGPAPKELEYTFKATARYGNGATLKNADFDFGDGNKTTGVKPDSSTTVSVAHTYAKEGKYSVKATLRFVVNGKDVTATNCSAVVEPKKAPVPECKPGVPVGDPKCEPCTYDSTLPADDPNCKPCPHNPELSADDPRCGQPLGVATTLPNTGAGNIIALTAAALVGGFLFYRHRKFKQSQATVGAKGKVAAKRTGSVRSKARAVTVKPAARKTVKPSLRRRRQY